MNILINHCWCSDSIWGGCWDGRVIVSLYRVPDGKTYYDPPDPDWALVEGAPYIEDKPHHTDVLRMRPDVHQWLIDHVEDRREKDQPKGWAVGSDAYNARNPISFLFFFHRRNDAMAFIKRWSHHKKPVHYLNYFTDHRRELDLKSGTTKRVKR